MANINQYLTEILEAVYGEEVRSSIYNAIDIINKVGEKVLTMGTAVTSVNSSVSGYYENSLYLNSKTFDLWKCTGTNWSKQGNLLGAGISSVLKESSSGLVDTYQIKISDGTVVGSFKVTNANKIDVGNKVVSENTSVVIDDKTYVKDDLYINNETWIVWKCDGTKWINQGTIKGDQGIQGIQGFSITGFNKTDSEGLVDVYTVRNSNNDIVGTFNVTNGAKGDRGEQGLQGVAGFSPTITYVKEGKVATITINDITGSRTLEIKDGNDGSGTGDMLKATYDTDDDGIVDIAKTISSSSIDNTPTAGSDKLVKSGGLYSQIGDLNNLTTETKTNLVEAINEAAASGGDTDNYLLKTGDTMTGDLYIENNASLTLGSRASGSTVGLGSLVTGRVGTASGIHSIAEGNTCNATGNYSSARGSGTAANGNFSVAEGDGSQANGLCSHVSGKQNRATESYQAVFGTYNSYSDDENHTNAIFEVGNGTAISDRRNAFQVMKNGDIRVQGDIYLQDGTSLADYILSIVGS